MANFQWGFGGQQITSPEAAKRQRSVAEALIAQSATPATNWSSGLADVAAALSGTVLQNRVDEAEAAGRERAGGLFADLALNSDPNSIIAALTSPDAAWASDAQTSIATSLLQNGLDRSDPLYQLKLRQAEADLQNTLSGGASDENYFGNPIAFQGPDGSIQYGQIGSGGSFKPIELPEGSSFAPNTRTVDTGLELLTVGPGGEILERIPKQVQDAAYQQNFGQQLGTAAGQAVAGAPGDINTASTALALVDSIGNDPEVDWATGADAPLNQVLLGTSRFGFEQKVNQAKAGAFLAAIESLRGMGALSNAEGQTATQAITRLNTGLSPKQFREALAEYRAIVERGLLNAQRRLENAGPNAPSAPIQVAPSADGWQDMGNGIRIRPIGQ